MILIDSNIWCFYFDRSAREHRAVCKALEATLGKEEILSSTVVFMEVAHFLVRNLGVQVGNEKLEVPSKCCVPTRIWG